RAQLGIGLATANDELVTAGHKIEDVRSAFGAPSDRSAHEAGGDRYFPDVLRIGRFSIDIYVKGVLIAVGRVDQGRDDVACSFGNGEVVGGAPCGKESCWQRLPNNAVGGGERQREDARIGSEDDPRGAGRSVADFSREIAFPAGVVISGNGEIIRHSVAKA